MAVSAGAAGCAQPALRIEQEHARGNNPLAVRETAPDLDAIRQLHAEHHRAWLESVAGCDEDVLLHAGVDTSVIALWLGHEQVETTQIYLHADLTLKEQALSRTTPPNVAPGRYLPPDTLLAFLEAL